MSKPIQLAMLKNLIAQGQNDSRQHIPLFRDRFDNMKNPIWVHPNTSGYLLICYKTHALLKDGERVICILRHYSGTQAARSNEKLRAFAPKDCYFLDETTTEPNISDWTSRKSWIALV